MVNLMEWLKSRSTVDLLLLLALAMLALSGWHHGTLRHIPFEN
jgi:hypothetical protein